MIFYYKMSIYFAIRGTFDICCHGYRWEEHYKLSSTEERERIAMAVQSLIKTTGQPPDGWYCRYGPSVVSSSQPDILRISIEMAAFSIENTSKTAAISTEMNSH